MKDNTKNAIVEVCAMAIAINLASLGVKLVWTHSIASNFGAPMLSYIQSFDIVVASLIVTTVAKIPHGKDKANSLILILSYLAMLGLVHLIAH